MKDICNRDSDTSQVSVPSIGSRALVEKFKVKFLKEASTIAGMDNDHIVRIHDIFEENETAYYVMEYLGEDNLQSITPNAGFPLQTAVKYIRQIADALSYVHSQSILHLDLKPSNVMFRRNSEVVLIDFGVSKHYDDSNGAQTTSSPIGMSRGYAPLEQHMVGGVSQFTPTTDIYSLGATFYKLVTGVTPPSAEEVNEEGLPDFDSSVPAGIASVIEKCMQPRRKDRPQSIREFISLLDAACLNVGNDVVKNKMHERPVSPVQDDKTQVMSDKVNKPTPPQQVRKNQQPQQTSNKTWLWVILIVTGVLLLSVCLFYVIEEMDSTSYYDDSLYDYLDDDYDYYDSDYYDSDYYDSDYDYDDSYLW